MIPDDRIADLWAGLNGARADLLAVLPALDRAIKALSKVDREPRAKLLKALEDDERLSRLVVEAEDLRRGLCNVSGEIERIAGRLFLGDPAGGPVPSESHLFALGTIHASPGALEKVSEVERIEAVERHARGDWGDVEPEDVLTNARALSHGSRLHSVYRTGEGEEFWIMTELDRSATTVLLPSEY